MTRLDYIAPSHRRGLSLSRKEAETNQALARQWRADNPEFFATDPLTLPDPGSANRTCRTCGARS